MDFVTPLLGLLLPYLPKLLSTAAEQVVGEGAKKAVFEGVPQGVVAIWQRLRPQVEADPIAKAAADKVVAEPENAKRQTALELALEDLLKELEMSKPELVVELQQLLLEQQAAPQGKTYGDVTAKTIYSVVQGDHAKTTQNIGTPPSEE